MDHVELCVHAAGHACRARDEILPRRIGGDAYSHALADAPVFSDVLGLHVRFEAAIDLLGDLPQSELAKCDKIPATKEILQRTLDFFRATHLTALHPALSLFRTQVAHHTFLGD